MKIAFLMDPLENIQPETETTSHLMYECNERGHTVYFLEPHDIYIRGWAGRGPYAQHHRAAGPEHGGVLAGDHPLRQAGASGL